MIRLLINYGADVNMELACGYDLSMVQAGSVDQGISRDMEAYNERQKPACMARLSW